MNNATTDTSTATTPNCLGVDYGDPASAHLRLRRVMDDGGYSGRRRTD
jgi:hypothetical protein